MLHVSREHGGKYTSITRASEHIRFMPLQVEKLLAAEPGASGVLPNARGMTDSLELECRDGDGSNHNDLIVRNSYVLSFSPIHYSCLA